MKNIYYSVWVDSILAFRKKNPNEKNWCLTVYILTTWFNALNLWTIFSLLRICGIDLPLLKMDFIKMTMINNFLCFLIEFAFPFVILNYFLIFYKERFNKLINYYPDKNGKLAFGYAVASATLAFFTILIHWFIL